MTDFAHAVRGLASSLTPEEARIKLTAMLAKGTQYEWGRFFDTDKSGEAFSKIVGTAQKAGLNPNAAPGFLNVNAAKFAHWIARKEQPDANAKAAVCKRWILLAFQDD